MSLRLSRVCRRALAVATVVCGGLWAPVALAQGTSLRPEAEPQSILQTNLPPSFPQPPLRRNGLLRLEEQLSRAFQFLKPNDAALQKLAARPLPVRSAPPVQSRGPGNLLNQRQDWMFLNPEELTAAPKAEDLLNMPQFGKQNWNNKSSSSVEKFYQDLEQHNAKARQREAQTVEDMRRLREERSRSDQAAADPSLPAGLRDKEKTLRKLLGLDAAGSAPVSQRESASDFFGLGQRPSTTDEELAHKAYIKEFNQWLNRSTATPATTSTGLALPPGAMDPTRPATPAGGYSPFAPYTPAGRPSNFDPTLGTVNPTLAVSTPQNITAKVLNQWNPYYVPPKVEPPKTPPPQPAFDVPRRKF